MINLEKELEKFRETVKENPDLFEEMIFGKIVYPLVLIEVFLNRSEDQKTDYNVVCLVRDCLITFGDSPVKRRRPDNSLKVYNPQQVYIRLKRRNYDVDSHSKKVGFNGFNYQSKNFVANVYKIIYDAYLKETAEKERKRRTMPIFLRKL